MLTMSFCICMYMSWLCLSVYICIYIPTYKIHTCILMINQKCVCHLLNSPRSCVTVMILDISTLMLLIKRIMIWGRKAGIYPRKMKRYIPEEICMSFFPHGSFLFLFYLLWSLLFIEAESHTTLHMWKNITASDCIAFNHAEIYLII